MALRNQVSEIEDHRAQKAEVDQKIADHHVRMKKSTGPGQQTTDNRRILNAMLSNKSALDFNGAMRDYDNEHYGESLKTLKPSKRL